MKTKHKHFMKLYLWADIHQHTRVRTLDTHMGPPCVHVRHFSNVSSTISYIFKFRTFVGQFLDTCPRFLMHLFTLHVWHVLIHFPIYTSNTIFLVKNEHQNIALRGTMIGKLCFNISSEIHSVTLQKFEETRTTFAVS